MLPDTLQRPCRNIRHFLRGTHASLHDGPNSIRLVRALSKTQEQTRQVFPTRCQHGVGTICYRCLHRKASCPGESSLIKSVLAKSKTPSDRQWYPSMPLRPQFQACQGQSFGHKPSRDQVGSFFCHWLTSKACFLCFYGPEGRFGCRRRRRLVDHDLTLSFFFCASSFVLTRRKCLQSIDQGELFDMMVPSFLWSFILWRQS